MDILKFRKIVCMSVAFAMSFTQVAPSGWSSDPVLQEVQQEQHVLTIKEANANAENEIEQEEMKDGTASFFEGSFFSDSEEVDDSTLTAVEEKEMSIMPVKASPESKPWTETIYACEDGTVGFGSCPNNSDPNKNPIDKPAPDIRLPNSVILEDGTEAVIDTQFLKAMMELTIQKHRRDTGIVCDEGCGFKKDFEDTFKGLPFVSSELDKFDSYNQTPGMTMPELTNRGFVKFVSELISKYEKLGLDITEGMVFESRESIMAGTKFAFGAVSSQKYISSGYGDLTLFRKPEAPVLKISVLKLLTLLKEGSISIENSKLPEDALFALAEHLNVKAEDIVDLEVSYENGEWLVKGRRPTNGVLQDFAGIINDRFKPLNAALATPRYMEATLLEGHPAELLRRDETAGIYYELPLRGKPIINLQRFDISVVDVDPAITAKAAIAISNELGVNLNMMKRIGAESTYVCMAMNVCPVAAWNIAVEVKAGVIYKGNLSHYPNRKEAYRVNITEVVSAISSVQKAIFESLTEILDLSFDDLKGLVRFQTLKDGSINVNFEKTKHTMGDDRFINVLGDSSLPRFANFKVLISLCKPSPGSSCEGSVDVSSARIEWPFVGDEMAYVDIQYDSQSRIERVYHFVDQLTVVSTDDVCEPGGECNISSKAEMILTHVGDTHHYKRGTNNALKIEIRSSILEFNDLDLTYETISAKGEVIQEEKPYPLPAPNNQGLKGVIKFHFDRENHYVDQYMEYDERGNVVSTSTFKWSEREEKVAYCLPAPGSNGCEHDVQKGERILTSINRQDANGNRLSHISAANPAADYVRMPVLEQSGIAFAFIEGDEQYVREVSYKSYQDLLDQVKSLEQEIKEIEIPAGEAILSTLMQTFGYSEADAKTLIENAKIGKVAGLKMEDDPSGNRYTFTPITISPNNIKTSNLNTLFPLDDAGIPTSITFNVKTTEKELPSPCGVGADGTVPADCIRSHKTSEIEKALVSFETKQDNLPSYIHKEAVVYFKNNRVTSAVHSELITDPLIRCIKAPCGTLQAVSKMIFVHEDDRIKSVNISYANDVFEGQNHPQKSVVQFQRVGEGNYVQYVKDTYNEDGQIRVIESKFINLVLQVMYDCAEGYACIPPAPTASLSHIERFTTDENGDVVALSRIQNGEIEWNGEKGRAEGSLGDQLNQAKAFEDEILNRERIHEFEFGDGLVRITDSPYGKKMIQLVQPGSDPEVIVSEWEVASFKIKERKPANTFIEAIDVKGNEIYFGAGYTDYKNHPDYMIYRELDNGVAYNNVFHLVNMGQNLVHQHQKLEIWQYDNNPSFVKKSLQVTTWKYDGNGNRVEEYVLIHGSAFGTKDNIHLTRKFNTSGEDVVTQLNIHGGETKYSEALSGVSVEAVKGRVLLIQGTQEDGARITIKITANGFEIEIENDGNEQAAMLAAVKEQLKRWIVDPEVLNDLALAKDSEGNIRGVNFTYKDKKFYSDISINEAVISGNKVSVGVPVSDLDLNGVLDYADRTMRNDAVQVFEDVGYIVDLDSILLFDVKDTTNTNKINFDYLGDSFQSTGFSDGTIQINKNRVINFWHATDGYTKRYFVNAENQIIKATIEDPNGPNETHIYDDGIREIHREDGTGVRFIYDGSGMGSMVLTTIVGDVQTEMLVKNETGKFINLADGSRHVERAARQLRELTDTTKMSVTAYEGNVREARITLKDESTGGTYTYLVKQKLGAGRFVFESIELIDMTDPTILLETKLGEALVRVTTDQEGNKQLALIEPGTNPENVLEVWGIENVVIHDGGAGQMLLEATHKGEGSTIILMRGLDPSQGLNDQLIYRRTTDEGVTYNSIFYVIKSDGKIKRMSHKQEVWLDGKTIQSWQTHYTDKGRPYQEQVLSVNPETGDVMVSLVIERDAATQDIEVVHVDIHEGEFAGQRISLESSQFKFDLEFGTVLSQLIGKDRDGRDFEMSIFRDHLEVSLSPDDRASDFPNQREQEIFNQLKLLTFTGTTEFHADDTHMYRFETNAEGRIVVQFVIDPCPPVEGGVRCMAAALLREFVINIVDAGSQDAFGGLIIDMNDGELGMPGHNEFTVTHPGEIMLANIPRNGAIQRMQESAEESTLVRMQNALAEIEGLANELRDLNKDVDPMHEEIGMLNEILRGEKTSGYMVQYMRIQYGHEVAMKLLKKWIAEFQIATEKGDEERLTTIENEFKEFFEKDPSATDDDRAVLYSGGQSYREVIRELHGLIKQAHENLEKLPLQIQKLQNEFVDRSRAWEAEAKQILEGYDDVINSFKPSLNADGSWGNDSWKEFYTKDTAKLWYGGSPGYIMVMLKYHLWVESRSFDVILANGQEVTVEFRNGVLDPKSDSLMRSVRELGILSGHNSKDISILRASEGVYPARDYYIADAPSKIEGFRHFLSLGKNGNKFDQEVVLFFSAYPEDDEGTIKEASMSLRDLNATMMHESDFNRDGAIDQKDIDALFNRINRQGLSIDDESHKLEGDLNRDGVLDIHDVAIALAAMEASKINEEQLIQSAKNKIEALHNIDLPNPINELQLQEMNELMQRLQKEVRMILTSLREDLNFLKNLHQPSLQNDDGKAEAVFHVFGFGSPAAVELEQYANKLMNDLYMSIMNANVTIENAYDLRIELSIKEMVAILTEELNDRDIGIWTLEENYMALKGLNEKIVGRFSPRGGYLYNVFQNILYGLAYGPSQENLRDMMIRFARHHGDKMITDGQLDLEKFRQVLVQGDIFDVGLIVNYSGGMATIHWNVDKPDHLTRIDVKTGESVEFVEATDVMSCSYPANGPALCAGIAFPGPGFEQIGSYKKYHSDGVGYDDRIIFGRRADYQEDGRRQELLDLFRHFTSEVIRYNDTVITELLKFEGGDFPLTDAELEKLLDDSSDEDRSFIENVLMIREIHRFILEGLKKGEGLDPQQLVDAFPSVLQLSDRYEIEAKPLFQEFLANHDVGIIAVPMMEFMNYDANTSLEKLEEVYEQMRGWILREPTEENFTAFVNEQLEGPLVNIKAMNDSFVALYAKLKKMHDDLLSGDSRRQELLELFNHFSQEAIRHKDAVFAELFKFYDLEFPLNDSEVEKLLSDASAEDSAFVENALIIIEIYNFALDNIKQGNYLDPQQLVNAFPSVLQLTDYYDVEAKPFFQAFLEENNLGIIAVALLDITGVDENTPLEQLEALYEDMKMIMDDVSKEGYTKFVDDQLAETLPNIKAMNDSFVALYQKIKKMHDQEAPPAPTPDVLLDARAQSFWHKEFDEAFGDIFGKDVSDIEISVTQAEMDKLVVICLGPGCARSYEVMLTIDGQEYAASVSYSWDNKWSVSTVNADGEVVGHRNGDEESHAVIKKPGGVLFLHHDQAEAVIEDVLGDGVTLKEVMILREGAPERDLPHVFRVVFESDADGDGVNEFYEAEVSTGGWLGVHFDKESMHQLIPDEDEPFIGDDPVPFDPTQGSGEEIERLIETIREKIASLEEKLAEVLRDPGLCSSGMLRADGASTTVCTHDGLRDQYRKEIETLLNRIEILEVETEEVDFGDEVNDEEKLNEDEEERIRREKEEDINATCEKHSWGKECYMCMADPSLSFCENFDPSDGRGDGRGDDGRQAEEGLVQNNLNDTDAEIERLRLQEEERQLRVIEEEALRAKELFQRYSPHSPPAVKEMLAASKVYQVAKPVKPSKQTSPIAKIYEFFKPIRELF